jgi:hypothetical protein
MTVATTATHLLSVSLALPRTPSPAGSPSRRPPSALIGVGPPIAAGRLQAGPVAWSTAKPAAGVLAVVVRWGTTAAVCFMLVGILVMMVAENGVVVTHEPAVEDDRPT